MAYVDPGQMNRLVDIWDASVSPAVLFEASVHAQIIGIDSTTEAPQLKNIFGDYMFGDEQLVSKITHQIVIQYRPGLTSRMYIVYHDPDNGDRQFNINRIVDKDEQKVELHILGVEWIDGQFDALLNTTANILTCDTSIGDEYGLSDSSFTTVATGIPCRVSMNTTVGRGRENWSKNKAAISYREVLMRPWFADQAPDGSYIPFHVITGTTYNTQPLTHEHWLQIPTPSGSQTGEKYDIIEINNPGLANHHLEVRCVVVLP